MAPGYALALRHAGTPGDGGRPSGLLAAPQIISGEPFLLARCVPPHQHGVALVDSECRQHHTTALGGGFYG